MRCEICLKDLPEEEVLEIELFTEKDEICRDCLARMECLREKDKVKMNR